jgi:hypothetical protein
MSEICSFLASFILSFLIYAWTRIILFLSFFPLPHFSFPSFNIPRLYLLFEEVLRMNYFKLNDEQFLSHFHQSQALHSVFSLVPTYLDFATFLKNGFHLLQNYSFLMFDHETCLLIEWMPMPRVMLFSFLSLLFVGLFTLAVMSLLS